ncbi:MAG: hypothetical protein K2Y18_07610 [Alphaproteobacteria bacterium]|nr:hypothetical protein [Alphaproteobacteria bacterium]
MSDFQVLTAVRGHLLNEGVSDHVHLALPPKARYPLILIELEEILSPYPVKGNKKIKSILAHIKFKVSAYSERPGMEEAVLLSNKLRGVLEGKTLWLPGILEADKSAMIRFLACVTQTAGAGGSGSRLRVIYHYYDAIVRG